MPPIGISIATFNLRGQQVIYEYNAAGDINIGAMQNRLDLNSAKTLVEGVTAAGGMVTALTKTT